MNIDQAFPSRWLKASDVPETGDLVLTMSEVQTEEVGGEDEKEQKPVLYFREVEKGLVLNKTNAGTIRTLYGAETRSWAGKRVALFATEVSFGGKQTLAIRVRQRAPAAQKVRGESYGASQSVPEESEASSLRDDESTPF